MPRLNKNWINLDYNDPLALKAEDIMFSASETLKNRINQNINGSIDYDYNFSDLVYRTNSNTWIDTINILTPITQVVHRYRLNWYCEYYIEDGKGFIQVIQGNSTILGSIEIKKNKGWLSFNGFGILDTVQEEIKLQFKIDNQDDDEDEDELMIRNIKLDIWRIN